MTTDAELDEAGRLLAARLQRLLIRLGDTDPAGVHPDYRERKRWEEHDELGR